MSDYVVLGLLAILGPVLVVGLFAQMALWIGDRPLPYDPEYERRQREDRQHLARLARRVTKRLA